MQKLHIEVRGLQSPPCVRFMLRIINYSCLLENMRIRREKTLAAAVTLMVARFPESSFPDLRTAISLAEARSPWERVAFRLEMEARRKP